MRITLWPGIRMRIELLSCWRYTALLHTVLFFRAGQRKKDNLTEIGQNSLSSPEWPSFATGSGPSPMLLTASTLISKGTKVPVSFTMKGGPETMLSFHWGPIPEAFRQETLYLNPGPLNCRRSSSFQRQNMCQQSHLHSLGIISFVPQVTFHVMIMLFGSVETLVTFSGFTSGSVQRIMYSSSSYLNGVNKKRWFMTRGVLEIHNKTVRQSTCRGVIGDFCLWKSFVFLSIIIEQEDELTGRGSAVGFWGLTGVAGSYGINSSHPEAILAVRLQMNLQLSDVLRNSLVLLPRAFGCILVLHHLYDKLWGTVENTGGVHTHMHKYCSSKWHGELFCLPETGLLFSFPAVQERVTLRCFFSDITTEAGASGLSVENQRHWYGWEEIEQHLLAAAWVWTALPCTVMKPMALTESHSVMISQL